QKTAGTGTTTFSIAFNNAGTVTAQTGTIRFNGGGTMESVFNANASAAIQFNGGEFSYSAVPILNGPGAIQFTGGSLTLLDDVIPNLQMTGGAISLSPEFQGGVIANLSLNGSTLSGSYVVTGTFNCANGVSGSLIVTNGGVLNWTGGNISGPLDIQSGATANWSGGAAANIVNVRTNAAMNLVGNNTKFIQNVLTNAGTVTWLGGDFSVYNYAGGYSGAVENLSSGLWDIQCDRSMYNGYGNLLAYFHNSGTMHKSAGTGTTTISISFNNAGTLDLESGLISFSANNAYAQTGAILRFGLGGSNGSGQTHITGNMAFDGTLSAGLVRGYIPQAGDAITLVTYGSRSGSFNHLDLPTLSAGLGWELSYNSTAAQLRVVTNSTTTAQIAGLVRDAGGNGIANVTVSAFATNSSGNLYVSSITDINGHYSLAVSNATWTVGLQNLPAKGYNSVADQTVTVANSDRTANFVVQLYSGQLYTITTVAHPSTAGTTTGAGVFTPGSVVTVSAIANTSTLPYYFTNWTENGVVQSVNSAYPFLAQRNRQLTANFTLPAFAITISNNPPNAGSVVGARTNFYGETNLLTAQPNFGYAFSNWTENGVVVGSSPTLSTVIYTNHSFVANYAEANLSHVVTTATSPGGIATISGAGIYTNGQTAQFTAPATITISPVIYTFQKFTLSNNLVSSSSSFSKTFATTDPTNLQYVAVYHSLNVVPQVTNTIANFPNPIPATTNLTLTFRFDRSMDPNITPVVTLTNSATTLQPESPNTGTWTSGALLNDTYVTPRINITAGMGGTNRVFIAGAHDTNGNNLALTNTFVLVVDATPPVLSGISVNPGAQSAVVNWISDELTTSQADFGTTLAYGTSTPLYNQLIQSHALTLTGLAPTTTYHFRVRSHDLAGNETVSADQSFTTLAAPDLQAQNLAATGTFVSGGNIVITWNDANTGSGATYTSWYDQVLVTNITTGQALLNTSVRYDASTSGNIASGGNQSRQVSFHLPDGPNGAGNLQIVITANAYHNQFETDFNNNREAIAKTSTLPAYPDLQVVAVALTNAVLQSGSVVGLQWQDTNSGNASITASFQDRITVSNIDTAQTLLNSSVTYDVNASGPLAAGQSADRHFSFTLPNGIAGAGHLHITITSDFANNIFEYNAAGIAESNNTNSLTAISALAAYPDLAVTNIIAPANASAGQTIPLAWTDLNLGNAAVTNSWSDQVFVSDTPTVGSGQWIGTFQMTNLIAAGNSLSVTQNVTLPPFVSGSQWIIVKANASASFFELNTADNSLVSTQAVNVGSTLTLTLSRTTVSESAGSGAITGTVSRNGDTSSDLTVSLSSLGGTNVSIPANMIIPAGRHSASFSIGVVNQLIAGGSIAETISASASGFPTATASLQILHDAVAALTMTLNTNAVPEDAATGVAFVTVTRNANFGQPLVVTLVSDSPTALTLPATATIPAGEASVVLDLTPIDDHVVGDTRTVHLLAGATGFSATSAVINVLNVNEAQLSLSFASSTVSKGAASPATIGTVSRNPVLSSAQKVYLTSDNPLVTVPSIVTIPADAASADFNIGVGDDHLVTGTQTATLNAQALTPARLIDPNGATSATFTILDSHGPTLTLSFADNLIAKGSNTVGTVTRNTLPTNSISVNLTASPAGAISLPASVAIPQNQSSATFTVSGVLDGTQTGPRKVAVTASSTGFNSAVENVTVSDIYFPDLAPISVTAPAQALTDNQISVNWIIANKGLADATNHWIDYVYLASDNLGQNPILIGFQTNTTSLLVGASYTNHASFYLPDAPGNYWLIITADGGNRVSELNKQNNNFIGATPIAVNAAYRAALTSAAPTAAPAGTPIVLSGHTFNPQDSSPAPSHWARVRVLVNGTRRVFDVLSDANGNFSYTFQPLANEAGDYTAGADYPLVDTDPNQVSFALLGMRSLPAGLTAQLLPNTPVTNQLVLSNLTDHALTGLAVTVPDLQGNLSAQFTLTNTTVPGNGTMTVNYTLQSALTRVAQIKFSAQFTSSEGAQLAVPANITVVPLVAQLEANPAYLNQGMLVGTQTLVSFDIINTGGAATGDLAVQLPGTLPWMALSSPALIPSIPAGGKATVTLALNPPADLPLTLYQGSLAVANNNTGVSVPFHFRAVSEGKGDLRVTTTDDYTYYVAGAPNVTNATVTVRDAITTSVVAQTNSDATGVAYFTGLPEGTYVVDSSAPQHNPFRGSAVIVTGTTNELEAFMTRQLVSYQWSVVPTDVPDEYKIQLESVFETEVPVPNVVIVEPQVMMFVAPGEVTQFDLKLRNEGLIAAQGVTIQPPNDPVYLITPLVQNVGTIPAQSEISVPVTIQLRSAPAPLVAGKAPGGGNLNDLGPDCGYSLSPCLPKINLNVQYYYPCGGNNVVQNRSAQLALLCTGKDLADRIKSCLKDLKTLTGSANLASVGCNAISAFLSCVGPDMDPCVLMAINTACGALTGG
ncbi:MAG TPA: CARDB domain-containing protein, partial [Verrucomicrobiae bacterium]